MTKEISTKIPTFKVSIWETIAVWLGALTIAGVGSTWLAMKFLSNAATPKRAEAIASNIMSYSLPGGSQGLLGLNIAGAKVALVASEGEEPDIQLLVARIPVGETGRRRIDQILDSISLGANEDEFKVSSTRVESRPLCGEATSVAIKQGQLKTPGSPAKFTVTYRASVTLSDSRYVVNLLTNGQNAEQKAETVFNSLQCQQ